jgi:septum formation protein
LLAAKGCKRDNPKELAISKSPHEVILASKSKFRAKILQDAGICFTTMNSDIDESATLTSSPRSRAATLARLKAEAVFNKINSQGSINSQGVIVIGCDQVLGFEGKPYGKVESTAQAFEQIKLIQGKTHFLHTATELIFQSSSKNSPQSQSLITDIELRMRPLSDKEIQNYIATNEWIGCAGCYRIESLGKNLFEQVQGSDAAIIGLDILPLLQILRSLGVNPLE